ncbi:MAG: family 78 glycoside hydrolase catalytic domain, partial [Acutalibacteraceae bacterium]|nr:family 78 glycoside hydrolase catalytic domain [Acutalibacteraceae bacterium]
KKYTFVSDENLEWKQSRIIENNIYFGEVHDMSLADELTANSGFQNVIKAPAHETQFFIQDCPADRAERAIKPAKLFDLGEVSIYDMGENISGYPVVAATVDGANITVRCSEEINPDGTLNFDSCDRGQIQKDEYRNAKKGEECMPWFTWHGFRYFELTNNAEPVRCEVIHSDCAVTSSFESGSEMLNWLYDAYIRTQLSNMHSGVPSDCPHIERLGYTGDGQLCCEAAMMLLDSQKFYKKWLEDISDCQSIGNGHVQHTAPFMGGGGGPAGWGGAIAVVPYEMYKIYGDKETFRRYLPKILRYFDYLDSRSYGGLVCREEEGGWCLGDWCPPEQITICEPVVNTALYVKQMMMTKEASEAIGESETAAMLEKRIEEKKQAILNAYYSPQTGSFIGDAQGANSFAVDIGLGGERAFNNTKKKYDAADAFDTGIFGTDILIRVLFERGCADTAFRLLTSTGKGSFYNMKKQGATTIWENWDGERSHSHPMFGAVTRYLFSFILGITQEKNSAGYEKIVIAPQIPDGLNRASGHITTVRGEIAVSFVRTEREMDFYVTVPQKAWFTYGSDCEYELWEGENHIHIDFEE